MTINWEALTPEMSFFGGILIGLAALILMFVNGRVMGVSGILSKLISPASSFEFAWRITFVVGIILAPTILYFITGNTIQFTEFAKGWQLYSAAFLVGVGTAIGSGCTSGHGICGISMLSMRSIIAVTVFLSTAIITVFIISLR